MAGSKDAPGQLRLSWCADDGDDLRKLTVAMQRSHEDKERPSKPDTLKTQRKVFKTLKALGVDTITKLIAEDTDRRFVEFLSTTRQADSTRDLHRRTLHSIIRFAHKYVGSLDTPKLPKLIKPGGRRWREQHPPTSRYRPPSPSDRSALLDHLKDQEGTLSGLRLYALTMIEAETEISLASALRLTPKDVDLAFRHRIRYFPRDGRRPRFAPTSHRLETVLCQWLEHCGASWLFPAHSKTNRWSQWSARQSLQAACRASGIEAITFEQLRRYPATSDSSIDFDKTVSLLESANHRRPATLVQFMRNRDSAPFEDVMDQVYGGQREDVTIRVLVNRTNNALSGLGSPLRFETQDRSVLPIRIGLATLRP
jgi:integrase